VFFEDRLHLLDCLFVTEDYADLSAGFELQLAEALAAEEGGVAVAQDRAQVQARGKAAHGDGAAFCRRTREDADLDSLRDLLVEKFKEVAVAELHFVHQQLFLCAGDEFSEALARIDGADYQIFCRVGELLPARIAVEESNIFLDESGLGDDNTEGTAEVDIQVREVEAEEIEQLVVDDHHLAVVTDEVIGGACNGNALRQQPRFQAAKISFFALIGVRDERFHAHASLGGSHERFFDLGPVETEDQDANGLFRFAQCVEQGLDALVRLNEQLHAFPFLAVSFPGQYDCMKRRCSWMDKGFSRQHRPLWVGNCPLIEVAVMEKVVCPASAVVCCSHFCFFRSFFPPMLSQVRAHSPHRSPPWGPQPFSSPKLESTRPANIPRPRMQGRRKKRTMT